MSDSIVEVSPRYFSHKNVAVFDIDYSNKVNHFSDGSLPPPMKRMRHSLSSSTLNRNDANAMDYETYVDLTSEYMTYQSKECNTESSIMSDDMREDIITLSSKYNISSVNHGSTPIVPRPAVWQEGYQNKTSSHKRLWKRSGSSTVSSSTSLSQSSTLTELSVSDVNDLVLIDDNDREIPLVEFVSSKPLLYNDIAQETTIQHDSNHSKDDDDHMIR